MGGKYKVLKTRKGDRLDEFLIGEDELNLMERAENENSVIVAQMTPFFEN